MPLLQIWTGMHMRTGMQMLQIWKGMHTLTGMQTQTGMQMRKGMKMGKKEESKGKKRPPKSLVSPPPPPPPTPPLSLVETAPAPKLDFKAHLSRCPAELNVNFVNTLNHLVAKGIITDRNSLLKTEESFKQSWDIGIMNPISYKRFYPTCIDFTQSSRKRGKRYFDSAVKNNYFDVPDPTERPDKMSRGFFVIYPEGQCQADPIFEREPNLIKVVPLLPKLGTSAVEYHNFMTGSDLHFSKIKKANLFFEYLLQFYFITLEATDKISGKEVTCQSRVCCNMKYNEMVPFGLNPVPVPIVETYVESFHRVED